MEKKLSLSYNVDEREMIIPLNYEVSRADNAVFVSCKISESTHRHMLQLNKFELKCTCNNGIYTILFNEEIHSKNSITILFAEEACAAVLRKEKMQLNTELVH